VVSATGNGPNFTREARTLAKVGVPGNLILDPCNADSDGDGLVDESELATSAAASDSDDDGVSDGPLGIVGPPELLAGPDNCPTLENWTQSNSDLASPAGGDSLGDVCDDDDDGDGCSDAMEGGRAFAFGGARSSVDFWDFFDVTGDRAIDLQDALAILDRFGAQPGQAEYDPLFDRYAADAARPWRTAAAVGAHVGIDLSDALVNLQSFGHTCVADP
jgi:hypothetical protein